jgi:hypothetical protein
VIRQLIREMLLQEKTLSDVINWRYPGPEVDTDSFERGGIKYGDKYTTRFRRKIKSDWNKHADHSFFQDPKKLQVVHFLGYYSYNRSLDHYFPKGKVTPGKIPGIDMPSRNELSCFGYTPPVSPTNFISMASGPYFTFKKYRVTFVSNVDAATERLSKATPEDIERMKGSGLAKRPASLIGDQNFPIDAEDLEGYNTLEEVVIDNWVVDTCYGPEEEAAYAEELGLKYEVFW